MITETVARGMAVLLQSSVQVEVRDAERELFSIDYVLPDGVLDEGEGLEYDGHVGVEDPVDVGVDFGHRLKICFVLISEISGSPGLDIEDFLVDNF